MPIITRSPKTGLWTPGPLAAGPFGGMQGGAIAGLLTAEVEALAGARGWGTATSAACWFLRPTPVAELRTEVSVVREGGRVQIVDNQLWSAADGRLCANARITLVREDGMAAPGLPPLREEPVDPAAFPLNTRPPMVPGPWFMDAMEVRVGGGASWFRMKEPLVEGAGPLAGVLGAADWAHGIARPLQNVLADPNPNLTVHLLRPPRDGWVGVRPIAQWDPEVGRGFGGATLHDPLGQIGLVSMAIVLTPFPWAVTQAERKPEAVVS